MQRVYTYRNAPRAGWIAARACLGLLAVLASGCVYFARHTPQGACPDDLDSPLRNFCVVTPGAVWRGERPTTADAKWLLDHGVGSVVSLQLDDRGVFEAASPGLDLARSVSYIRVSGFSPLQMLRPAQVDNHVAHFLAILKEAPKPVFVHCRAGIDRTGVVVAAYRVLIQGVSREQAIAEMARWHSPWIRLDAAYIRGLSENRRAQIMRKVADWESRPQPSARIECQHGKCAFLPGDIAPKAQMERQPRSG